MNGYALSRAFWNWAFENPDKNTPTHAAMFMWFVEKWNRCGQKQKISITTSETMEALGINSRNTFSKVFSELVEYGFIEIIQDSKNQYTSKIISLAQNLCKHEVSTDTALDKALIQQGSEQGASTVTINKTKKQDNKETIKQHNHNDDDSENKKKEKKVKKHLFSESEYFDFQNFQVAFVARFPDYAILYDLSYYHQKMKEWGGGKKVLKYKKIDWIETAKEWMDKNPPNNNTSPHQFVRTPETKKTLGDVFANIDEARKRMQKSLSINVETQS